MSYGISLQSFKNKQTFTFPRTIVWAVFGPKCTPTPEGWGLMYDIGPGGILYLDDDEMIDGFSVMRPSRFAVEDIYAVARLVPAAINLDADFFVTDAATITGMPDWLLNALPKPPVVVHSADELLRRLAER